MTSAPVFTGALLFSASRMNEPFDLPVSYKGKDLRFPSRLLQFGYTHKFQVNVYGTEVLFEPDEEGRYRALVEPEEASKELTPELLQAIAEGIECVLK